MAAANPPETAGDIGSVKAAIRDIVLGPEFEDALVKVEARFADGLSIPRLTRSQVKTSETHGIPATYPWVEIVGEVSQPFGDMDAQAYRHRISVVWWANGDDEETVTALCERYVLAFRRVMKNSLLMPFIGNLPVEVGAEEYGVLGRKPELARPYVKAAANELFIGTIE